MEQLDIVWWIKNNELNGLKFSDSSDKVFKLFGKPDSIIINNDDSEWLFYHGDMLRIDIVKNEVVGWRVHFFQDTILNIRKYTELVSEIDDIKQTTGINSILYMCQLLNSKVDLFFVNTGYLKLLIDKNTILIYKLKPGTVYEIGCYNDTFIKYQVFQ